MQKNKKSIAKKDTRQRAAPRKVKGASPGVKEKTDYGIKKDAVPGKEKAGAKKKGFRKRLYDMRLFFKEKSGFRQNTDNKEFRRQPDGFGNPQDNLFMGGDEKQDPEDDTKVSRNERRKKQTRRRMIKESAQKGKAVNPEKQDLGESLIPDNHNKEASTNENPGNGAANREIPKDEVLHSTYNFTKNTDNRLIDHTPKQSKGAYRRFLYVKGRKADGNGFSWRGAKRTVSAANDFFHEVNGQEDDNSGTEAAGFSIRAASRSQDFVSDRIKKGRSREARSESRKKKGGKKQSAGTKTDGRFYKDNGFNSKAGGADPGKSEKELRKQFQKKQIKRDYAKAYRKARETAEKTVRTAQEAAKTTVAVAKKLAEAAATHAHVLIVVGAIIVLLLIIMTGISSCAAMFGGGLTDVMAGTYQSLPAELDKADESMTLKEMELQEQIVRIETDYPGYDEYSYNLATIGHNPYTLINYLSAQYVEFLAADVESEIQDLFDAMYDLDISEREETRTRTVTKTRHKTDPDTGEELDETEEYEDEEEYTVTILEVTLVSTPLETVISGRLSGDAADLYEMYRETEGARQEFYTPLDLDWRSCIKSYYGYRKNPLTGARQFHRGLDIAVPEGTNVYAAQSGTVVTADYDEDYGIYIVIADSYGYMTKYAHLESRSVNAGDTVRHGQYIGKTGSTGSITGSHLHIECLYNGEYYNPLFYFENGEGSLYDSDAPEAPSDADVAALLNEAKNYLGYPYVWGGSNPSTSFDCSGFVCWVLTNSGFANMPRTTAQGIYNRCTPIDAADAEAGDLIFFTGTYKSGNPVSHVGIYCGNGIMIHAGDPIKYSNINTPYWQSHFYSFARVPR